jgi:hypothetical protein
MSDIALKHSRAGLEFKGAPLGQVEAIICSFNKIDLDGDVVLPTAIQDGAEVFISPWNHSSTGTGGQLPVGRGIVHNDGQVLSLEGIFFMQNESARESFNVVQQMGAAQPWSWAFKINRASHGNYLGQPVRFLEDLEIYEASPVIRAASVGTTTTSAKELAIRAFLKYVRSQLPAAAAAESREREAQARFVQQRLRYDRDRFERAAS